MSSFSMDTHLMSSSLLVSSLVKNILFKTAPDIDKPPFQFIHTMDLFTVDTMLHDSPDLVIHRTEIWAVWRSQLGRKKLGVAWCSSSTCAAQCTGTLSCWNKVVNGQQYDVIMKTFIRQWRQHNKNTNTQTDTNVKDRQRTELSKDIKTRIHVYETKVFSLLKIQSKPTQHPVLTP